MNFNHLLENSKVSFNKFRVVLALSFPFMLFIVAPLTLYYGNVSEVTFSLADVCLPVLGIVAVSTLFLFIVLTVSTKLPKLSVVISGLLLGLAIAVWVQSQLFVWNFGPLDGCGIDWACWSTHMWVEGVVWLGIILFSIYVFAAKKEKIVKILLQAVFAIGVISFVSAYLTAAPRPTVAVSDKNEIAGDWLNFHPKNNLIFILLDSFQSDVMTHIIKKFPDEISFLDGFVFYDNVLSCYPNTSASIPSILTGQIYKNEVPFVEFRDKAYSENSLQKSMRNQGYQDRIIFNSEAAGAHDLKTSLSMQQIIDAYGNTEINPWMQFVDYGIFRAAPSSLKHWIYGDGDWFVQFFFRGQFPPGYHGEDLLFLQVFLENASIGNDTAGSFKFIHFMTPHFPLSVSLRIIKSQLYNHLFYK